jgi:hypothetical protein
MYYTRNSDPDASPLTARALRNRAAIQRRHRTERRAGEVSSLTPELQWLRDEEEDEDMLQMDEDADEHSVIEEDEFEDMPQSDPYSDNSSVVLDNIALGTPIISRSNLVFSRSSRLPTGKSSPISSSPAPSSPLLDRAIDIADAALRQRPLDKGLPNLVLRADPTGVAASEIQGRMLHSLLRLPVQKNSGFDALSGAALA